MIGNDFTSRTIIPMEATYLRSSFSCFVVFLLTVGCNQPPQLPKAGPPPIEFSFRPSQVPTKGMVAGIRNASKSETLTDFVVHVSAPNEKGTRSHRLNSPIRPEDSITVGWVELDGWKLKPGDQLSVKCNEYTADATTVVPEK